MRHYTNLNWGKELISLKTTSIKKNLLYQTLHFIERSQIFYNILKSQKKNWKMFCANWHANNNASDFSGLTTPVEKEITAFYTCPKKPTREHERDCYTRSWQHWVSRFCTVITQQKRHHSYKLTNKVIATATISLRNWSVHCPLPNLNNKEKRHRKSLL